MKKLLIVEDDMNLAQMFQVYFEENGYMVHCTSSGGHALKWLESSEKPEVIIMDIGLPDMNGLDLCKKVKSDMKLRKIPVIILTGRKDNASGVSATMDSGASLYLTKPVELAELLKAVEVFAAKYKEEQALLKNIHIKKFNFQDPRSR